MIIFQTKMHKFNSHPRTFVFFFYSFMALLCLLNINILLGQYIYYIHINGFIFNYINLMYLQISIKAYNNSIFSFVVFLALNSSLEQ